MIAVHVVGRGAITPLGGTWSASCEALARGLAAFAPVTGFDVQGFPSTAAAAVPADFRETADRRLALALCATDEAIAGLDLGPPGRLGVFIGAESGRSTLATLVRLTRLAGGKHFDHAAFGRDAPALADRIDAAAVSPAAVASALAGRIGARGPVRTYSLACASGSVAIAEAARAIEQGVCDLALCGGVGADIDPLMLVGFGRLRALSARGLSCPFDLRRDGFVVGEGAAMLVLSRQPGALPVALVGHARTLDAHHLTAPDPSGRGAEAAMRGALAAAGDPAIDYVQAHGTSTPLNDAIEAAALRRVLGDDLTGAAVGAVKGAVGHWIAGAGAIGALCALEAVTSGTCLPTAGLERPDPDCALPHVMGAAIERPVRAALVNAFAFGGANCSLVFARSVA
ncbi:MAG: hypothetical protein KC620_03620 [Myxococcales bacterium]|nr:hypothetical protein [Myxococcales bacterium]